VIRGFLLGAFTTMLLLSTTSISHETIKTIAHAEKMIDAWVRTKHCETAIVKELDILEGKILVKARGIYLVLTAKNSSIFEICPIGHLPITTR
jgi:hypothetical protein